MRFLPLILILLVSLTGWSQDVIVLRSGEQINCRITKIDGDVVFYNFMKDNRQLNSYIHKNQIRSFQFGLSGNLQQENSDTISVDRDDVVYIDTVRYTQEPEEWVHMVTFAPGLGIKASGFTVTYYGFNLKSTARWILPAAVSLERYSLDHGINPDFHYQAVSMRYVTVGLNPLYRIGSTCFLKLGFDFMFGSETLFGGSSKPRSSGFIGFSPSQGISFIPSSRAGFVAGLGIYEKVLSSKVYPRDFGFKLELGFKF